MKWDDLILAKDTIAPDFHISYYLLRKYNDQGIIKQRGRYWYIAESRATLINIGNHCLVQYCGDPSILWGLYRRMSYVTNIEFPVIEVIDKRGEIPYLNMKWQVNQIENIKEYLLRYNVIIAPNLWR